MSYRDDYKILDLELGESLEHIRQAYRDLVFIWHPDRVQNNVRLKLKAEVKIKEINEAYERLRFYQASCRSETSSKNSQPIYQPSHNRSTEVIPVKYWHQIPQDNSVWLY